MVVFALLAAGLAPVQTAGAAPASIPWGSAEHGQRLVVDVTHVHGGTDLVAVAPLDLTLAFAEAGAAGSTFDPASLRVHEVDASGAVIDTDVAFQFDPDPSFDATSAAEGELVLLLDGATPAGAERTFVVYFDTPAAGLAPAVVAPLVSDSPATDEGLSTLRVQTPTATWFYDLTGGGFSSLLDVDGNDWIDWHPSGGAAGNFRGIPNLVHPDGQLRPGSGTATTTVSSGPLRTSLVSSTASGWSTRWDIYPQHAQATIVAAPGPYWFLYEGTPGGVLERETDLITRSNGTTSDLDVRYDTDLGGEEWVGFSDPTLGRSLVLANHTDDTDVDWYHTMQSRMTVWGFGRDDVTPTLTGSDRTFGVAMVDSQGFAGLEPVARATVPATTSVGSGESAVPDTVAPTISGLVAVAEGGSEIRLTFSTDEPTVSDVEHGPTTAYGATVSTPGYTTAHDVTVAGLPCASDVYFRVTVSDGADNTDEATVGPVTTGTCTAPLNVTITGDGTVTRTPDQPAYPPGTQVTLTATPTTGATFIDWTGDTTSTTPTITITTGATPTNLTANFTTAPPPPPPQFGFVSDDFDTTTLGNHWTLVDPLGNATIELTGAGTGVANAELSVPAGTTHDAWKNNTTARIMQTVADTDFELQVGFDNEPTQRYQLQGLLIEADPNNWIRFDTLADGTNQRVFAATTTNGTTRKELDINVSPGVRHLRLTRTGDTFTAAYSTDTTTWTTAGTFTHPLTVTTAGVFAGNAGPDPAHTANIDYVFDTTTPIDPEDGTITAPLNVTITGDGTVTRTPDQPAYPPGTQVTLTATPTTGATFIDWTGDTTSTTPTITITTGATPTNLTANFTTAPATIDFWYGATQTFGGTGIPQRWVNVVGNASDPNGVASLSYTLNGGAPQPLSVGPDQRRLENAGDFNIEIDRTDLTPGPNTVVVTMVDGGGTPTTASMTVNWAPTSPSPQSVDWSSAPLVDLAQPVDGQWVKDGDDVRAIDVGYDRLLAIGDLSWQDYDVVVPVTVEAIGPRSGAPISGDALIGLGLRWQGHSLDNSEQPRHGIYPVGAYTWWTVRAGGRLELVGNDGSPTDREDMSLALGTTYLMRARVETVTGGTRYQVKVWEQGLTEPTSWDVEITEPNGPSTGSIILISHHFEARFGDVQITPLP